MSKSTNPIRKSADTNIIIRIVTNENPRMVEQLQPYLQDVAHGKLILVVESLVVAETVYVLQGLQHPVTGDKLFTKGLIAQTLKQFIMTPGIETVERQEILIRALTDYADCNVDFVDAYLAAKSRISSEDVLTWNVKDFKKMGTNYEEPK